MKEKKKNWKKHTLKSHRRSQQRWAFSHCFTSSKLRALVFPLFFFFNNLWKLKEEPSCEQNNFHLKQLKTSEISRCFEQMLDRVNFTPHHLFIRQFFFTWSLFSQLKNRFSVSLHARSLPLTSCDWQLCRSKTKTPTTSHSKISEKPGKSQSLSIFLYTVFCWHRVLLPDNCFSVT